MSGGKSNIRGIDYQLWYTAYEITKTFFDAERIVKPEARLSVSPNKKSSKNDPLLEVVAIDDIYVKQGKEELFFNVKKNTPSTSVQWTVATLKEAKVLSQFREQFLKTPNAKLVLISRSPSVILNKVLDCVRGSNTEEEVALLLEGKDRRCQKEWENLKRELELGFTDLVSFCNNVEFITYQIKDLKTLIQNQLSNQITNSDNANVLIKEYAIELAQKENGQASRETLIAYLKNKNIYPQSHVSTTLLETFRSLSSELKNQPGTFGNFLHSNIARKEEDTIISFIKKGKLSDESILILHGNAGMGKTTILRNVLIKIQSEGIPVLALKVDSLGGLKSYAELVNDEIGIGLEIERKISGLSEVHEHVVVLIDQLDALSQYLSSDRRPLKALKRLIHVINDNTPDNVKIIVSCRTYDLRSDPEMRELSSHTEVLVNPLNENEIRSVLKDFPIEYDSLSNDLKELLQIPLHLNLFCRVYNSDINLHKFQTLEDLYDELWRQKILFPKSNELEKDFLATEIYSLATAMYKRQQISIKKSDVKQSRELSYLITENLVVGVNSNSNIQFFHQSFYDYSYARNFYYGNEDLSKVILSHHQGIDARSKVKMVLAYLRGKDHEYYIGQYRALLTSQSLRYHLKVLLIQALANEDKPTFREKTIVEEIILLNEDFLEIFIEGVNSLNWFKFLIEKGVCNNLLIAGDTDKEKVDYLYSFLFKMVRGFPKEALEYILSFPEAEHKPDLVIRLLSILKDWSHSIAIELFEKFQWYYDSEMNVLGREKTMAYENAYPHQKHWVKYMILKDVKRNIEFHVRDCIEKKSRVWDLRSRQLITGEQTLFLSTLFKEFPEAILAIGISLFDVVIQLTKGETISSTGKLFSDDGFYKRTDKIQSDDSHLVIRKYLFEKIKELAVKDEDVFRSHINDFLATDSISYIQLLIYGYNAAPQIYVDDFVLLFQKLEEEGILTLSEKINVRIRKCLKSIFPFCNEEQRAYFLSWLLEVNPKEETMSIMFYGEKRYPKDYGQTQLLYFQCIPEKVILLNARLKKRYQELKRKFPSAIKDHEPQPMNFTWTAVNSPIPPKAFLLMSYETIVKVFKDHNQLSIERRNERRDSFVLEDGFYKAFREDPNKMMPILLSLVQNEEIPITFKLGALENLVVEREKKNLENVLKCFNAILNEIELDGEHTHSLLKQVSFFIDIEYMDQTIFDFLEYCALNYPESTFEPEKKDNKNFIRISVRGTACEYLVRIVYAEDFVEAIFLILDKAVDDSSIDVKISILIRLAYLNKVDKKRALVLFLKITRYQNQRLYFNSVWSARCFIRVNFILMKSFFEFAMTIKEIQDEIGQILMISWLRDYPGSKELLYQAMNLSDKAKKGALAIAFSALKDKELSFPHRCDQIIRLHKSNPSRDIRYVALDTLRDPPYLDFSLIEPYLAGIVKEPDNDRDLRLLLREIGKYVSGNADACIRIFQEYKGYSRLGYYATPYNESPVKIALSIYHTFLDNNDDEGMEKSMDLLDYLLKENSIRLGFMSQKELQ